jgi:hypothetical protein
LYRPEEYGENSTFCVSGANDINKLVHGILGYNDLSSPFFRYLSLFPQ